MEQWLVSKLDSLPQAPGVYLMKDREGEIVYVGKAVNLRSRVRSYFNLNSDSRAFVALLERILGDLDTVVVSTEKEALLLENELIKKHRPKFNVRLRDDKNFICLRLDKRHAWPRLEVVRRQENDGAVYFGPYASASSIRETLRIINRYFQLRTCSDNVLENRRRPCLLHQIGRCPAPCVFDIPREDYRRSVEEVELFLRGKADVLVEGLRTQMKVASSELRYEDAARLRDKLWAIERSLEKQKVTAFGTSDQDVLGFHREADRLLIYLLFVRNGRVSGGEAFPFSGQEFPDEELLASFINLYYGEGNFLPDEILLPFECAGLPALEEVLSERRGGRVSVAVPKRGEKLELLRLARTNAEAAFRERKRSREEATAILERIKERLHLRNVPWRMECFDISHFQGAGLVASQVATTDGEPDRSRYRHYVLKTVRGNDDFASMHEILHRRLKRGLSENDLPDLIVIDGGKGQLASAQAAMRDLGIEGVDMVGLAKSRDLESQDSDERPRKSPERLFLPGRRDPIVLPQNSPELFMLTRLRDEAHRFAITFGQKKLRQRTVATALREIPSVGAHRAKVLLKHFGSLKRVQQATLDELAAVDGIGPLVAEKIHAFLHEKGAGVSDIDEIREASFEDAQAPAEGEEPTGSEGKNARGILNENS